MATWYLLVCLPLTAIPYTSSLQVHISRDKVTWPGAIIKKAGEGMPNYDNNLVKGTLFVTVDVEFPRGVLSDEKQEGMTHS